ncbi:MAG: prepilin-type N-terminal cleavage/methylation domain-containing protein [Sedimentisphaerales bacterium]|nr:prepilin-type N-terminal cleavage/methylation domain-containing protein [Sedimentisphaerales bacterium]
MGLKHKQGFTLVELLVVISIIALLMSIMMPALRKARKQARKLVCANNMRQWGIAVPAYAADHDGFFPNNGLDPIRSSYDFTWVSATMSRFFESYLFKKLDNTVPEHRNNILFCPTDKRHRWLYEQDLQFMIDNGLVGYNVLFGNDEDNLYAREGYKDYTWPSCPNGLYWVTRKRLGSRYNRGPILSDMMHSWGRDIWGDWGIPFGNHPASGEFIPEGGNFLFEDGSLKWYKGVDNGRESFYGGEVGIGAAQGEWIIYYGLPDVQ